MLLPACGRGLCHRPAVGARPLQHGGARPAGQALARRSGSTGNARGQSRQTPLTHGCGMLAVSMSKRAVVFGSSGQLGVELVRELNARGFAVHGFERKAIDITERERVEQTLAELDPGLVL